MDERKKRSRNTNDDTNILPLSKRICERINNLHLHNSASSNNNDTMPDNITLNNNAIQYSPDLTEIENPYYYSKNKVLFELHVERFKRSNNPD